MKTTFSLKGAGGPVGPLPVGTVAPPFWTASGEQISAANFGGSSLLLAFQPAGWNPATADVLRIFNAMLAELPALPGALPPRLLSVRSEASICHLDFAGGSVPLPVMQGGQAAARAFGVDGQHALFVLDATGVVRWREVAASGCLPSASAMASAQAALTALAAAGIEPWALPRRHFLAMAFAVASWSATAGWSTLAAAKAGGQQLPTDQILGPQATSITLKINGVAHPVQVEPRQILLDVLRDLGLTGTKKGCDHGQCGACTVLLDGRRINSCLNLALMAVGKDITTVEGLAQNGQLHPVQEAFIRHDAFQCGYCTPGQIMSAVALLKEPCGRSASDLREAMSGNICRCGAYPHILAAVQDVRGQGGHDAAL